ncbi:endonuclease MutS2 [Ruminiclostridium herbifermentans]|uniref:Endonuclease MutS2 n=1 Tax=Ruminiclostridium herbifermentans TaxID=2488810 RepID=A0A4U7JE15_9FIRM|nr:endonuclease MutS2 [Ruminiclostridium herbifermentans]QNU65836.1 endonuclease MutS2 [Ruminiclostridium herbifermentans]
MNEKTLRVLEYGKIIDKLKGLTASELGRELVEELSPQTDFNTVEKLLSETNDGVSCIMRRGSPPLGGITDIRPSLKRLDIGGVLNPGELLRLGGVLRAARKLKSYANDRVDEDNVNCVNELISCLESNARLEQKIDMCIISEEEIADNASPALNTIRRQIKDHQASIKDKLNDLIRSTKYQKYIQESIVTIRGDRYVIPVKQEHRNDIPGLVHDSSSSGATLYIEPMAVVEANNSIKQLKIKEQAEIERILAELSQDASLILPQLNANMSIMAKLDFIFAKARLAIDYKCMCPKINQSGRIIIKKGRHPLLDEKKVVPIDFWIGDTFNSLIVTGPNTGGKTVSLKTVGLFTLMAQSGLHVPANEGTEISVFNKIYADIGDEQSIEQSLSTFSSHMKNIVEILKNVDSKSLVMFDELGAGTDPTEGAALAMAILECLHQMGATTLATTHYSELKVYAISTAGVENASCEFDVETLKPTYRLLIGVPGKSNAFAISKRLGLTDDIIERSKEFLSQEDIRFEDILLSIEKNRSEAEREKMRAESYRLEAERLKKDLEEQKSRLAAQKEKELRKAREEARQILMDAKREAEELVAEMKRLAKEQEEAEVRRQTEELRQKLNKSINKLDDSLVESIMPRQGLVKPPKNLKPGDTVLIVNLNQKGTVLTTPDKSGEAQVQAGIMKINVHISNLKLIDEQKQQTQKTGIGKIGVAKAQSLSSEIDLRGMLLDEAIDVVDKYLDDASIAGMGIVTLIHGKGTGALRAGLHQYLKHNAHTKSFRLGKLGEGESGVTVVELK